MKLYVRAWHRGVTAEYIDVNKNINGVEHKVSLGADPYKVSLSLWQEKTNSFVPVDFNPRENIGLIINEINI